MKCITYGSVFSGIEAATVAWKSLGFKASWFSEIDLFPSAVLDYHYPSIKNLGDMTKIAQMILDGEVEAPEILVGGSPCQAFSVAGNRLSLDDDRGLLTIKYVELANAIDVVRRRDGKSECVIVWENVPGVLNTRDNAFGCFLGELTGGGSELKPSGKRWTNAGCVFGPQRAAAWRILDAQYFGLAQRRKRVFVVASARKGFCPAQVLFEFDGVRRDIAPSREQGEEAASNVRTGFTPSSFGGYRAGVGTLRANGGDLGGGSETLVTQGFRKLTFESYTQDETASTIMARDYKSYTDLVAFNSRQDPVSGDVFGTLDTCSPQAQAIAIQGSVIGRKQENGPQGQGYDESGVCFTQAAADRHAVAIAMTETCYNKGIIHNEEQINARTQKADAAKALRILRKEIGEEEFTEWGLGILDSLQPPEILRQEVHGCGVRCQACEGESELGDCTLPRQETGSARALLEMRETGRQRRTPQGRGLAKQCARELGANLSKLSQQRASSTGFLQSLREASEGIGVLQQALSAIQEMGRPSHDQDQSAHTRLAVRRLTPKEAERLQGFPDNYTQIPWRNKPAEDCPDGHRYKALGNSMAVPVMRWIGERIDNLDDDSLPF